MTLSQIQSLNRVDKMVVKSMVDMERARLKNRRDKEVQKYKDITHANIERSRDEDMAMAMSR